MPFLVLPFLTSCGDLPRPFAGNPGATAIALSRPPPPRLLIPTPSGSLLADADAAIWAHDLADALVAQEIPAYAAKPHPGDWRLKLTADLQGATVTPHYQLLDYKDGDRGDIAGAPVPASVWAEGRADSLQQAAAQAAPQIVSLLRAVDATLKQSDPNSLYNRPAKIYFSGVTGAPGDGDASLARFMRLKLPETGDQLVAKAKLADFLLRGTVKLTDEPGNQQQVEIHWLVTDARGTIAGDIAQGHDLPHGTLDHHWGDIAGVVTDEAAGGVHEVITNFSGRRKKGEAISFQPKSPGKDPQTH